MICVRMNFSSAITDSAAPAGISLTAAQARRIALAAQGFGRARPDEASRAHLDGVVRRLGLIQIDFVNVLARAHLMPGYSRLGAYQPEWLEQAGRGRKLFEYWGHEASLIRCEIQPLLRWRMARAERGDGIYKGLARFGREHADADQGALRRTGEARPQHRARSRRRTRQRLLVGLERHASARSNGCSGPA